MWKNEKELKENWQKILKKHKIERLGIEENHLTIARFKNFRRINRGLVVKFFNMLNEIEKIREIKNKQEITLITKSQRINEKVFAELKKHIEPSVTELELAWKIQELAHKHGADGLSFDPIIAFGSHSAIPHHLSSKTRLKKGDLILVDMGMKYQGYCSDMTRIIFTAPPTPKQKEIYELVLKAQKQAISKIKAGITGAQADTYARKIIEDAGYGEQYGHAGGHGVGLDIHEIPSLSDKYQENLKASSVITVEPGIYLPGEFGIRIEDMILVQKSGNKNLTLSPSKIPHFPLK